mmetsp:Transcript_98379/g.275494  ORF Transcript_98379/g.275494 Transcript_98379/m.275494 type:complete len:89 (-) Transcript_98379:148-414(-)
MPMIPTKLKGPNDFKLFIKQSGNKATVVTPTNACVRVISTPKKALARDGNVTLKIILYAKTLQDVTMKQAAAGIQAVLGDTARSQACR